MHHLMSKYVMPKYDFMRFAVRRYRGKPQRAAKVEMPNFVLRDTMQTGILLSLEQEENSRADRAIASSKGCCDRRGIGATVEAAFRMRREVVVFDDFFISHSVAYV